MNIRPIIERELICEARNPTNHWLRLIAATLLLFLGAVYVVDEARPAAWQGIELFHVMNRVIVAMAFLVVPVLAADSVAREKREGTLGLLFLTRMKPRDLLLGKCVVHGLRALVLLVATVPVLSLPVMMGGVSGLAVANAVAANLGALFLGTGAGIHASVRQVEWLRAVAHALGIGLIMLLCYWTCLGVFALLPDFGGFVLLLGAVFIFNGMLRSATIWLIGNWRRELYRPWEPFGLSLLAGSPFWRRIISWPQWAVIERNPVAWLEEHSWNARLAKWVWLGIVLGAVVLGGCVVGPLMDYSTWLYGLMLLLAAAAAFNAATSFQREQETGALELLLVTPLTLRQIVAGRLRGMLLQFLPATLLLLFFWLVPVWFEGGVPAGAWTGRWPALSTLVTVPFVGLWFSLGRWHHVTAWMLTLLTGYLLPLAVVFLLRITLGSETIIQLLGLMCFTALQVTLAAVCFRWTLRNLEERTFAMAVK